MLQKNWSELIKPTKMEVNVDESNGRVGKLIAEKAIKKGIKNVVFDRGGYIYHGRIKNLADAARENGLIF